MVFPDRSFFDEVYRGRAPWDVESAQPHLLALFDEYPPAGLILDLGCGTGDLAIALARRGHEVLGLDFASAAIAAAEERAAALPTEQRSRLEFRVADALHPSAHAGRVGSIVDSGFYHLFDAPERSRLAEDLARALGPGGRYYMLGFAIAIPSPDAPRQVTVEEVAALFAADRGWIIRASRPAEFLTNGFGRIPAIAACIERS
jgi:SAM-dependent methyltransferase